MKKFIIMALAESFVFSLCFTGIYALLHYIFDNRLSNKDILLILPLTFVGWFIWKAIEPIIKKRK